MNFIIPDRTLQKRLRRGKQRRVLAVLLLLTPLVFAMLALTHTPTVRAQAFLGMGIAEDDQKSVVEALKAIKRNQWSRAEKLIAGTRNPQAVKLYYWLYYTKKGGPISFNKITSFITHNPEWPWQEPMRRTAEDAMPDDLSHDAVVIWFDQYPPLTTEGMSRYLNALVKTGRTDKAQKLLNEWWPSAWLDYEEQTYFLKYYGGFLNDEGHKARLGRELSRKRYRNAKILADILGKGYPALAKARIALAEGQLGVDAAIAGVPAHLQNDSGLLLERLKWRRRNGKHYGVLEILHNMPPAHLVAEPDEWWKERNIVIRQLIEKKDFEGAYLLAEKHVQKDGVSFAEAEFLAGWLALRYVGKPWRAFEHFEALYHKTSTPISRSRGAYWAGRASEELGHQDIATMWYKAAARHQTTFYGQLAGGKLAPEDRPKSAATPVRTLDGKHAFEAQPMPQIVRLLAQAGMDDEVGAFLMAMAEGVDEPQEFLFLAELAEETDQRSYAVRIAKRALYRGVLLMDHLYPTMLSSMTKVDVEWALVHGLIRQESGFKQKARSPAGAQGLMQLMPATAKDTARRNGVSYHASRLSDANYNIRLGSLYLKQMLNRYDGSYPLALAAYNGGPGRTSRWLNEIGDPRSGAIDMIDWIETIPVEETRNYVQRVLENVFVYRLMLEKVQSKDFSAIHVAMNPAAGWSVKQLQ